MWHFFRKHYKFFFFYSYSLYFFGVRIALISFQIFWQIGFIYLFKSGASKYFSKRDNINSFFILRLRPELVIGYRKGFTAVGLLICIYFNVEGVISSLIVLQNIVL